MIFCHVLRNYISKQKVVDKYTKHITNDDYFSIIVAENEIYSIVNQALDLLPKDCAEIFNLLLQDWSVIDIAKKLNYSKRTVYNKKDEAINILKKRLHKDKLLFS